MWTHVRRWHLGAFHRASDASSRIIRRNADGATTADMAYIAQQAAIEYERALNAGEIDEEGDSFCGQSAKGG